MGGGGRGTQEESVIRGGAEGVASSKVSLSPPTPPSSHPDNSSLFLTRYWRASLRKNPQKRKEKTRTRAAMRRRERGKPEETRGPPGTEDRVVLVLKLVMLVVIQRWNREMIVTI